MFRQLLLIALLFTGFAACKPKPNEAYKYSEAITSKEGDLKYEIKFAEDRVKEFGAAQQFDSIAAVGEHMEKIVQKTIDEVDALTVPVAKGAGDFKAAAINYFKYIKSLYTGYKNAGNAKTDEERQEIGTELQKIIDKKMTILNVMQAAQRKFADDNGFKVQ